MKIREERDDQKNRWTNSNLHWNLIISLTYGEKVRNILDVTDTKIKHLLMSNWTEQQQPKIEWKVLGSSGVEVLTSGRFDHHPILLSVWKEHHESPCIKRIFKFDTKWVKDKEGEQVVWKVWQKRLQAQNFQQHMQLKLQRCSKELINWNAKKMRYSKKEIEEKVNLLKHQQTCEGP